MKLVSWNVNGIRACMKKGFMDFFQAIDADIFCIQETKMQPGQLEIETDGYVQYMNSADKKGYSGVMVFSKKEPLSVSYGLGIDEHDHEGRVITCEYDTFYLVCVYTPNSKDGLLRLDYRMQWEDAFRAYLQRLKESKSVVVCGDLNESPSRCISKPKPVIVCGDLNVARTELDIKNPKNNRRNAGFTDEEREKMEELLKSGFADSFRYLHPDDVKYSWWSYRFNSRERNAGWRIDYFLTSEEIQDKIKGADILTDIHGSDHCPVTLDIDI